MNSLPLFNELSRESLLEDLYLFKGNFDPDEDCFEGLRHQSSGIGGDL